ncbi:MAG: PrsW family glutamic-type intramembrane protease [Pseudomonadota bacterium]
MSSIAVAAAIVMPATFWGVYNAYRDRRRPEPLVWLALATLAGGAGVLLSQLLYDVYGMLGLWRDAYALADTDRVALLIYSIGGIGLIEETAKLAPFLLIALAAPHFDERVDGIIYASFVALGFAIAENVSYLPYAGTFDNVVRAFSGPLVHTVFASLWAYPLGVALVEGRGFLRALAIGLPAAALVHGLYDFVVIGLPPPLRLIAAVLVAAVWLRKVHLIERVLSNDR